MDRGAATAGTPARRAALIVCLMLLAGGCAPGAAPPPVSSAWVKIGADGRPLPADAAEPHHCVLDERTGLMWEVKREAEGLHFHGDTFTWYSGSRSMNMSDPGVADGGRCDGSRCDTEAFVEAVNAAGLCQYHDWQLPARRELLTLGDSRLRESGLVVDTRFFEHEPAGEHWTAETFRLYPQAAWAVDTRNGLDRADRKNSAKAVQLVRRHALGPKEP